MEKQTMFDALEPEILERLASRRAVLKLGGDWTKGLALASIPLALAATAKSAFADHLPAPVVNVLNFALTLEHLGAEFYILGVASGIIPETSIIDGDRFQDRRLFTTIRDHEIEHVKFLQNVLGHSAVAKPNFDFTAGGMFQPFKDYDTFKLLAQAFEDLGVRAYKGQAPALLPYDAFLTAALTIHSVEARHASEVRRLRGWEGWIPFDQPGAPAAIQGVYVGEEMNNLTPATNVSQFGITDEQVTESFDEPATMEQVLAQARPFIKG